MYTGSNAFFINDLGLAPQALSLKQLVRRNRKIPDSFASRVEDGVGDGCGDADHPELAHALNAERVHDLVIFLDKHCLDFVNVCVHRRVINPKASHSQEIGGVVWGIGMALQEATQGSGS